MLDFEFRLPTRIIFGRGKETEVGRRILEYGKKILLVYGGGSIKKSGLYEKVVKSLKENEITFFELSGVKTNPQVELAYKGIDICRKNGIEFILAVGGGSAIDTSKCIAAGTLYDGDIWEQFTDQYLPSFPALPVGTILTIPASGSEASNGCVMANGLHKRYFDCDSFRPKFSILNPELCYTVPKYYLACGMADIMWHAFERYFTNVKNVDLSNLLCEAVVKAVVDNAKKAFTSQDYDSLAEIMWAGVLAHNDLLTCGREIDDSVHTFGMEIGGRYDLIHGETLSMIAPTWMRYVYKHDIELFKRFATNIMSVDPCNKDDETIILEGIDKMEQLYKDIGLPVRLSEASVEIDDLEYLSEMCVRSGPVGHFLPLNYDQVLEVYNLAKSLFGQ